MFYASNQPTEVEIELKGKILLTGFEPFGGEEVNPSGEVAKSLDGSEIGGFTVVSRILPVKWKATGDTLRSFIEEVDPVIVLSLGLAAGRAEISVEKVAINYQAKAKDNEGNIPEVRYIIENGPDAYFASVPSEEMVEEITKGGIPARLSLSAGAYLCNYAFYFASHYVRKTGRKALVGFIHVPATPEMVAGKQRGGPSMTFGLIREACITGLKTIVDSLTDCG